MTAITPPLPADDLAHVVRLGTDDWQALAGQRLFITGGSGFFGSWLLESICAANDALATGIRATVLSRDPASCLAASPHLAARPELAWLSGDIRDFGYPAGRFDAVVHLATAASATLNATAPRVMFETIVDGTRRVLDFARHCGARRLLLSSSGAVYGRQPDDLLQIPEDFPGDPDPLAPASAYAEGKRAAELLCALTPKIECVVARCFAFIGPRLPLAAHFAAGNFLRDALAGGPVRVRGDGRALRSYLYAADLVVWLLAVLVRGRPGRAYNVGSDEAVSVGELAQRIVLAAGTPAPPVRIEGASVAGVGDRYVPSTERCRTELGLLRRIGLDAAIARTLAWHRGPQRDSAMANGAVPATTTASSTSFRPASP